MEDRVVHRDGLEEPQGFAGFHGDHDGLVAAPVDDARDAPGATKFACGTLTGSTASSEIQFRFHTLFRTSSERPQARATFGGFLLSFSSNS